MPVDYIAFGPVFTTATKSDTDPVVGLELLRRVRETIGDIPLVAIGGINANNLTSVFQAGADSAAMIAGIVGEPKLIAVRFAELTSIFDQRR